MDRNIKQWTLRHTLSFTELILNITRLGDDCHLLLYGGERPHLGCCVLATPRPSLIGDGSRSATSSVLNAIGHKDEALCRLLAETVAADVNCTVVCTGGVHIDNITATRIQALHDAALALAEESCAVLKENL